MQSDISVFVALGGGLLSFLSPCVLPLVPAYFGSLAGPDVLQTTERRFRPAVFLHSLIFVLGFAAVFVGLGALVGWAGLAITSRLLLRAVAGWLLVAFGAFMLLSLFIPALNFEKHFTVGHGNTTSYIRSLGIGSIFAFAWTPCAGPILGGILALAFNKATIGQGAGLLGVYSLGLGLPFLAIGLAFDFLLPVVKQFRRFAPLVYLVSGLLLITAGILTLTR
jgi:cytochrome c-type biogenesis protein